MPENNRIDKAAAKREIEVLDIPEEAKAEAYAAIYHLKPRGVSFGNNLKDAILLENVLSRLGIPYLQSDECPY